MTINIALAIPLAIVCVIAAVFMEVSFTASVLSEGPGTYRARKHKRTSGCVWPLLIAVGLIIMVLLEGGR